MPGGLHDATRRFDDRVRAVSRPSARQLINKPTALPYHIRVPFFTVLYWPRPASSAPALFILVLQYIYSGICPLHLPYDVRVQVLRVTHGRTHSVSVRPPSGLIWNRTSTSTVLVRVQHVSTVQYPYSYWTTVRLGLYLNCCFGGTCNRYLVVDTLILWTVYGRECFFFLFCCMFSKSKYGTVRYCEYVHSVVISRGCSTYGVRASLVRPYEYEYRTSCSKYHCIKQSILS